METVNVLQGGGAAMMLLGLYWQDGPSLFWGATTITLSLLIRWAI